MWALREGGEGSGLVGVSVSVAWLELGAHRIEGCMRARNGVIRKRMRCDRFIQEQVEDFDIAKQQDARQRLA